MTNDTNKTTGSWVRVMADYSSDGLWDVDGCGFGIDEMPVSAGLRNRIEVWCSWYEKSKFYLPERDRPEFDLETFSEVGLQLARSIKAELPSWKVIYFDESKYHANPMRPRSEFEYEVISNAK